jgi:hypothetical protein
MELAQSQTPQYNAHLLDAAAQPLDDANGNCVD